MTKKNFINNIAQYCDNWCNKCRYTTRCQFYCEHAAEYDTAFISQDETEHIERSTEGSKQINRSILVSIENKTGLHEVIKGKAKREQASKHPCTQLSLEYIHLLDQWFEKNKQLLDQIEKYPGTNQQELKPIEVIKWYQAHIYVKIARAVFSKLKEAESDCKNDQCDSNGSAKVAIIGIEKSINSFTLLLQKLKSQEDEIMKLILHLNKLLLTTRDSFPKAENFIRPGFDE